MESKKFFMAFLGILIPFIFCAYTWDSEVSPEEIGSWVSLKSHSGVHNLYYPAFRSYVVENTGKKGKVFRALVTVSYNSSLVGYSYFVKGIQKIYIFDYSTDRYVLGKTQDKNVEYVKKKCLKCHSKDFRFEEENFSPIPI